jgi:hypothetical protein
MTRNVIHGDWFYREFRGGQFRAKYYNVGWTYADLKLQVKRITKIRRWGFFGPFITYWHTPFSRSEIFGLFIIHRKPIYEQSQVDRDFNKIAEHYEKIYSPKEKIESPEDEDEIVFGWKEDDEEDKFMDY